MAPRLPPSAERAFSRFFLGLPEPLLRRIVGPSPCSADGLAQDVQLQALLWLIARVGPAVIAGGAVEDARASMERNAPTLDLPLARDVAAYDRNVPGSEGPVRARVYVPPSAPPAGAGCLVYFHGGGWVVGSIESHDRTCRALASGAGIVVVSVDYRLAPEHRFPAPMLDAVAATRWVFENARALGVDAARVAVGGDSAGGNLAAVVAQALRGEARRPVFQLLVYPATDLTRALPSHTIFRDSYFLPKASIDWYLGHYLPRHEDETDPRASPLLAQDFAGLPPALVVTAGWDPLRDEGKAYAEKLRAAGVAAEYVCVEGQMHGFVHLGGAVRDGARTVQLMASRLRAALA